MGIPDTSSMETIVPTSKSRRRLVALNDDHDDGNDDTPVKVGIQSSRPTSQTVCG